MLAWIFHVAGRRPDFLIGGVLPNFVEINSLKLVAGRFFTADENQVSAPVW